MARVKLSGIIGRNMGKSQKGNTKDGPMDNYVEKTPKSEQSVSKGLFSSFLTKISPTSLSQRHPAEEDRTVSTKGRGSSKSIKSTTPKFKVRVKSKATDSPTSVKHSLSPSADESDSKKGKQILMASPSGDMNITDSVDSTGQAESSVHSIDSQTLVNGPQQSSQNDPFLKLLERGTASSQGAASMQTGVQTDPSSVSTPTHNSQNSVPVMDVKNLVTKTDLLEMETRMTQKVIEAVTLTLEKSINHRVNVAVDCAVGKMKNDLQQVQNLQMDQQQQIMGLSLNMDRKITGDGPKA